MGSILPRQCAEDVYLHEILTCAADEESWKLRSSLSSRYTGGNEGFVPVSADQAAILRPTARRSASSVSEMH
jgi:hypothetical protein